MYIPNYFAENDVDRLHAAIERYPFATLVSSSGGELEASHLPFLLDRNGGARGTLLGHMAKANLQWRRAAAEQQVLVIFSGPHAYISPQWYQASGAVPTWNYVAVHAYGPLELIEEAVTTREILDNTVALFESSQSQPWKMTDNAADLVERLLQQVIAFRIPIDRLEGKWKLNQNRPAEQRERVIAKLIQQCDENSQDVAELMRKA
jgi:transcriptional regulator